MLFRKIRFTLRTFPLVIVIFKSHDRRDPIKNFFSKKLCKDKKCVLNLSFSWHGIIFVYIPNLSNIICFHQDNTIKHKHCSQNEKKSIFNYLLLSRYQSNYLLTFILSTLDISKIFFKLFSFPDSTSTSVISVDRKSGVSVFRLENHESEVKLVGKKREKRIFSILCLEPNTVLFSPRERGI